ncbi:MAG: restriction endonuclease subunit S [Deltaproteobacteria bacterium]|nr:restriction endonuclease subunit S [Deltaproteobacteria bacterium]
MIEELKSYESYKATDLPWARRLPSHWTAKRGKSVLAESMLPTADGQEVVTCFRDGQVTLRRNRRMGGFMVALYEQGYQGVRKGQLVVHAMDAFAGAIGISDSDGKCTPEYVVCNARGPSVHLPYVAQALRVAARDGFILASCPSVRERAPRFRWANLGDFLVPLPPPEEQAAIVRFLDYANRRIDQFIRSKKKLIALLNEQKQAIIHRAVTRGLDPNVKLKNSGVPWLGEVPAHWELRRLKYATSLQRGYDLPSDLRVAGPYPVVSSGGLIDTHHEFRAEGPGVVLGRYGSTEAVFYVETNFWPHNTSLFVTNFHGNSPRWAYYLLRSISKGAHSGKSAVPGVDRKDLHEIVVPVPPTWEQEKISGLLPVMVADVEASLRTLEREIELGREYRTRLVADVVTGQFDVCAAAASLPDFPDTAPAEPKSDIDIDDNEAA